MYDSFIAKPKELGQSCVIFFLQIFFFSLPLVTIQMFINGIKFPSSTCIIFIFLCSLVFWLRNTRIFSVLYVRLWAYFWLIYLYISFFVIIRQKSEHLVYSFEQHGWDWTKLIRLTSNPLCNLPFLMKSILQHSGVWTRGAVKLRCWGVGVLWLNVSLKMYQLCQVPLSPMTL